MGNAAPDRRASAVVTGCGYVLLLALGALEGLLGVFWYAGSLGPVPAAALGWALAILVTCVASAWGMQAATAGLMPAVGWFAAVFIMAMPTRGGSVVITSTSGGKWFLYGGTVCALAGVVASFATQARARAQGRDGWASRAGARHAAPRPGREPGQ